MEPISTLILSFACLVAKPITQRTIEVLDEPAHYINYGGDGDKATTFVLPYETDKFFASDTEFSVYKEGNQNSSVINPRELLKREVASYGELSPGWNGPASEVPTAEAVASLLEAIDVLPARLTLPRPMISESGEIAIYWDLPAGYAEMSANEDGTVAFFSRNESGEEVFHDELSIAGLTSDWFWQLLGHIDSPIKKAA